jgi:hypothetical protein
MEFIEIIYIIIYISLLAMPFWASYKLRERFKGVAGFCIVVGLSTVLMSSTFIALWLGNDWYLETEVAKLDLNGDGFWSQNETENWTPDEQKTMDSYIGDGGRNVFAAIIFPIFFFAYSTVMASIYWLVAILRLRYKSA